MKNLLLSLTIALLISNSFAQSYQWAKSIGSTTTDHGNSIATDASGNAYITGYFQDTADFDPGAGVQNLTSVGARDIFFAKYDTNGNYLWAKSIGSTSPDYGYSIATDASGNAYITGSFEDTADFDPGAGVQNLISVGQVDIFFAKYDANGNYLWAKSIGSTWDRGNSIATDASGNAYITGYFQGTADFDPGAGVQNLTSVGNTDIFFAKYQGSGSTGIDELKAQSSKLKVYPNPYTGKTNISYTLPEKTNVSLEIYNITGKKIHTLVNKNQNAGRHQYGFSAKDLGYGKGIYLLKFRVNEINITQLLLELR
ncbi:MAG: T9SS type A sorting domain-containing protein [Cytophagales bacterium]|nr:T9SS type A sorting domain-containing protein [Cytophagales bacterium]